MDKTDAQKSIDITNDFYARVAGEFSATRTYPWHGWNHLLNALGWEGEGGGESDSQAVLDLGCGNGRFAGFLQSRGIDFDYFGVDVCDGLLDAGAGVGGAHYLRADIISMCQNNRLAIELSASFGRRFDLCVAFGFMHHFPQYALRLRLLRDMLALTVPGGYVCVSFWLFLDDERIAKKATAATAAAAFSTGVLLDTQAGDYFLGWRDRKDVFRFCHYADDAEISQLVRDVANAAELAHEFCADGKNGALNKYLVFKKR